MMIKYRLLTCLLTLFSLFSGLNAAEEVSSGYSFTMNKKAWALSTDFLMLSNGRPDGRVTKDGFTLPSHYDLFDVDQTCQATGYCRLFSWGFLFSWGAEIEIFNGQGELLGLIEGDFGTVQKARFSIYESGQIVGVAFLDRDCTGFSIVDPQTESYLIASLNRHYIFGTTDYWSVNVYDPAAISPEIIKIFAAFAVDSQDSFKRDR